MSEELEMPTTQFDVALALARMEGQLTAVLQFMSSQGDALTAVTGDVTQLRDRVIKVESAQLDTVGLRDRVVAIESTRKATPPWWTWVAVVVPTVAFLLSFAKDVYAK